MFDLDALVLDEPSAGGRDPLAGLVVADLQLEPDPLDVVAVEHLVDVEGTSSLGRNTSTRSTSRSTSESES